MKLHLSRAIPSSLLIALSLSGCAHNSGVNRHPAHTLNQTSGWVAIKDKLTGFWKSPSDEEILDGLREIAREMNARNHQNKFGVNLTQYEFPQEILEDIKAAFELAKKSKNTAIRESVLLREVIVNGVVLILHGRGQSYDSAAQAPVKNTGWYLSNRDPKSSGVSELQEILDQQWLDEDAKKKIADFLVQTDFSSDVFKKSQGFPPQFEIFDDELKADLVKRINAAKTRSAYANVPAEYLKKVRPLEELISAANFTPSQKKLIDALPIERNLYDKSVEVLNAGGKFVDYFGREKETQDVMDALTRTQKGHVLLTGKAGVGKTTILEILSDRMVQGKLGIRAEETPVILEFPLTTITNQEDPTEIKKAINAAKTLAKGIERRVILYIDEAHVMSPIVRNAMKSFLTEKQGPDQTLVHVVLSTTSNEAQAFFKDSAYSRRFIQVHVREFNRDETIQLVKKANAPIWKRIQKNKVRGFNGEISDEALEFAHKYGWLEQPHAGNPTGTLELLEGAIVRKLNNDQISLKGDFSLEIEDVQAYLRHKFSEALLPDDPEFQKKFAARWDKIDRAFKGNEGFKVEFQRALRGRLQNPNEKKMMASIIFGPPAAGKSYFNDLLSEAFFNTKPLTVNGGDFKNGSLEINKLIGSPPGTVGSEDALGTLVKYITENPMGGVIKIEEMDYLHQDIIQFFTNMITDGEFTDGTGKVWKTSRFLIIGNSNIGQEFMVNPTSSQRMTWEQYATRKAQLVENVQQGGKDFTRVKKAKIDQAFDRLFKTIVTKSDRAGDSSEAGQESAKQRRRYKAYYLMSPDRQELEEASQFWVQKFVMEKKLDYGVEFKIPDEVVKELVNIENYDFTKGHSYVVERLEAGLGQSLSEHLNVRKKTFSVTIEGDASFRELVVADEATGIASRYALEKSLNPFRNPWGSNPEMVGRIRNLPRLMNQDLKGSAAQIMEAQELAKAKSVNWGEKMVFTLLGTTGNGKTQFAKSIAKALYADENAIFPITNLNFEGDLNTYLRPPSGYVGGKEETEFERWVKARYESGGGVINFDEFFSFDGMTQEQIRQRVSIFNKLYDLLDEQKMRIGGVVYDMSAFTVVFTGNVFQNAFQSVMPGAKMGDDIAEIERKLSDKETVAKYLQENYGFDPPKVARLGKIFVKGPLKKEQTLEVSRIMVKNDIQKAILALGRSVDFDYDPHLIELITAEKTTLLLGMRDVRSAFSDVILKPFGTILFDFPETNKIQVKYDPKTDRITWFADGKEIYRVSDQFDPEAAPLQYWVLRAEGTLPDSTPQLSTIRKQKLGIDPKQKEQIAIHEFWGHWVPSVILNGENTAESIVLEPGEGYGGYVRFRRDEGKVLNNLSDLTRRSVRLAGGHRAVFLLAKTYSSGGGGDMDADAAKRSDDFAHIRRNVDTMISNRLIEGLSEHSSQRELMEFREMMTSVFSFASEYTILKGRRIPEFGTAYTETKKHPSVGTAQLDEFARNAASKMGSAESSTGMAISYGMKKTMETYAKNSKPIQVEYLKSFASRLFEEMIHSTSNPTERTKLMEFRTSLNSTFERWSKPAKARKECTDLIRKAK